MQKAMQEDCAVFRTGETLQSGVKRIAEVIGGVPDIGVTDRGLIWNTDLIETLELDNLMAQACCTMESAENRKESRGAHVRLDGFGTRDDARFLAHSLATRRGDGPPRIDWSPVVITRSTPASRSYGGTGERAVLT